MMLEFKTNSGSFVLHDNGDMTIKDNEFAKQVKDKELPSNIVIEDQEEKKDE